MGVVGVVEVDVKGSNEVGRIVDTGLNHYFFWVEPT